MSVTYKTKYDGCKWDFFVYYFKTFLFHTLSFKSIKNYKKNINTIQQHLCLFYNEQGSLSEFPED